MRLLLTAGLILLVLPLSSSGITEISWGVSRGDTFYFVARYSEKLSLDDNDFWVRVRNLPVNSEELGDPYLEITENSLTEFLGNLTSYLVVPLEVRAGEQRQEYVAYALRMIALNYNASASYSDNGVLKDLVLSDSDGVVYLTLTSDANPPRRISFSVTGTWTGLFLLAGVFRKKSMRNYFSDT